MYWIEDDGLCTWKIENAFIKRFTDVPSLHDMIIINGNGTQAMVNIFYVLPDSASKFIEEHPDDKGVAELIETYEKVVIRIIAGANGRKVLTRDSIKDDIIMNYGRGTKV